MKEQAAGERLFAKCRLILSAGTLPRATFTERVEAAKIAGFDAISLFPQQFLAARRLERLSIENMRDILAEHEVALDEVDPLLDWFAPAATPSETLMMEMAEGLGARSINVAAAFVSDRSREEIVDCFGRTCERLAQRGLRADLEFLPWTSLNSLSTALEIIAAVDQPNAGVMLDLWHFFNSGEDLEVLRNLTPDQAKRITSLQLNDVPRAIDKLSIGQHWLYVKDMLGNMTDGVRVMGLEAFLKVALKAKYPHPDAQKMMKDALCSRQFPGAGFMPVTESLAILADKGLQPAIGIEVFNLDNYSLSPAAVARKAMASYNSTATR